MALSRGRQWISVHSLSSGRAGAGGIILGPNLLTNPNGAYGTAPWSLSNLTETTGQTDPLGGSTASLLTDNATSAQHFFTQSAGTATTGQKYLATFYFKPGTFTSGTTFVSEVGTTGINVGNTGTPTVFAGSPTNLQSSTVGGFFKVTFNFVGAGGSLHADIYFGQGGPSYVGTVQTQTYWGVSIQKQSGP